MKLAQTITGFNPELVGQFVRITGLGYEGKPYDQRGVVKAIEGEQLLVMIVSIGGTSRKTAFYEASYHFETFFERHPETEEEKDEVKEFYQLHVYTQYEQAEYDQP